MEELRRMAPRENLRFCEEVSSPVLGGITLAKILFV
jgi:hypothetical protein